TAVGLYPSGRSKELELYDLSGNVWEWQRNKYENPGDEQIDDSNARRVLRGGSWSYSQGYARAASRNGNFPGARYGDFGFRVVVVRRPPSHLGL
ncbi:MAG: formylglycine-generating enzyme family protein, partial [Chloroflexi bacterium]|nr:formylglycine-generating enzyme family protein [Chloroflexota bacterium]